MSISAPILVVGVSFLQKRPAGLSSTDAHLRPSTTVGPVANTPNLVSVLTNKLFPETGLLCEPLP
jgi:hypothetical protein